MKRYCFNSCKRSIFLDYDPVCHKEVVVNVSGAVAESRAAAFRAGELRTSPGATQKGPGFDFAGRLATGKQRQGESGQQD